MFGVAHIAGWSGKRALYLRPQEVPTAEELVRALEQGAAIWILGDAAQSREVSLAFLAPVIQSLTAIGVEGTSAIIDTEILAGAESLQAVDWCTRSGRPVPLAGLPRLRAFTGVLGRSTRSVLENPGLVELHVHGPLPARARVRGRLTRYAHIGARADRALPEFDHHSMTEFSRAGAGEFDLRQLTAFPGLRKLRFDSSTVTHLAALAELPALEELRLNECRSPEGWDDIPEVPSGWLLEPRPAPSRQLVSRLSEKRGWSLSGVDAPSGDPEQFFVVAELDADLDGWGWAIEEASGAIRPDWVGPGIPTTTETLDALMEDTARELGIPILVDSEGGFATAYFRSEHDAQQVASRLELLLSNSGRPTEPV